MPLPIISHTIANGFSSIPYGYPIVTTASGIAAISSLKRYFGGADALESSYDYGKYGHIALPLPTKNATYSLIFYSSQGGTSGVGASIVYELASRGAQIIILTQHHPTDLFLVDYIDDLRNSTNNPLIYAEQVDLSSLHSIRLFATKWIDNTPPRRLDMVILCGNIMTPSHSPDSRATADGLNREWQVNYLANFHLLSILSPALRAQPPDRDVRVIFATCSSYIGGNLNFETLESTTNLGVSTTAKPTAKNVAKAKHTSGSMYATSKLALMIFARSFQAHLANYDNLNHTKKNQPKRPTNSRVLVVDPGFSRTPGTRRWLTRGSLLGLLLYLITWPIWWLILKSPEQGAQSFLLAAMEAGFSAVGETEAEKKERRVGIAGGTLIKECRQREVLRKEIMDDKIAERLWKFSQEQLERTEKASALRRAVEKGRREEGAKQEKPVKINKKER
ncbi:conserved hypothetical protein [Uncinocarpus reesii 1704]|uniref:Oxidoreductase n=1 Tax=Uncinocarpus reesii (strain UAMH 1704) TaxID=336963 RepID=C4JDK6_UNCRE|nr:uncharacterized protein UREG_00715 [Uncinocarpus reesii 1704]EEP75868.1 conserved hypothetical protein [Uncinocarpus reesii 1704]